MYRYALAAVILIIVIVIFYRGTESFRPCSYCDDIGEPRGLINPFVWPYSSGECTPQIVRTRKAPFVHSTTPDHVELVGYGAE